MLHSSPRISDVGGMDRPEGQRMTFVPVTERRQPLHCEKFPDQRARLGTQHPPAK